MDGRQVIEVVPVIGHGLYTFGESIHIAQLNTVQTARVTPRHTTTPPQALASTRQSERPSFESGAAIQCDQSLSSAIPPFSRAAKERSIDLVKRM